MMKFGIATAALFALSVSVMSTPTHAATEAQKQACYEKYSYVDRTHACRKNLKTQESYKSNPKYNSCIKKLQKKCIKKAG